MTLPTEPAAYGTTAPASAQDGAADAEHDATTTIRRARCSPRSSSNGPAPSGSSTSDRRAFATTCSGPVVASGPSNSTAGGALSNSPTPTWSPSRSATVLFLVIWQTARLTRNLTLLALELTLAAVLNHLPFVHWLVPDVFDVTTWWISFLSLFGS